MSFGSSGFGFGTNNQNQTQPAANTGFGSFGAANTNTNTGGMQHKFPHLGTLDRPGAIVIDSRAGGTAFERLRVATDVNTSTIRFWHRRQHWLWWRQQCHRWWPVWWRRREYQHGDFWFRFWRYVCLILPLWAIVPSILDLSCASLLKIAARSAHPFLLVPTSFRSFFY